MSKVLSWFWKIPTWVWLLLALSQVVTIIGAWQRLVKTPESYPLNPAIEQAFQRIRWESVCELIIAPTWAVLFLFLASLRWSRSKWRDTQAFMSQNAKRLSTRQQIIAALSQIVGLPLTAARRAADMRTLQFGRLRPVERGSVGDFALHLQCPWRIEGPDGIVTGRLDLWEPVEENAPFDEDWDYERFPNLQDTRLEQWLARKEGSLVVTSVDADEFGGAAIHLGQHFVLRLFPAGTRGEDWRLFRPNTDAPHLVIVGGRGRTRRRTGSMI